MRIKQLYENKNDIYDVIFNSKFFGINIEPYIRDDSEDLTGYPLYHGSKKLSSEHIFKVLPMQRRTLPKDSSLLIHNAVNKVSEQMLGVPIRNLVFATESKMVTSEYGEPYVMIPIGDYDLYYSTLVEDLYSNNEDIISADGRETYMVNKIRQVIDSGQMDKARSEIAELLGVKNLKLFVSTDKILYRLPNIMEDFDSMDEAYQDEYMPKYVEGVYRVLIRSLYDAYEMKVIENSENAKDIHNILMRISQYIVDKAKELDRKWLSESTTHYIETIKKSDVVEDVPHTHEIMVDCKQVVFIPIDLWKDVVMREYFKRG